MTCTFLSINQALSVCLILTIPTLNTFLWVIIARLLSGWATTTVDCLSPQLKINISVCSKDTTIRIASSKMESKVSNVWTINPMICWLSFHPTTKRLLYRCTRSKQYIAKMILKQKTAYHSLGCWSFDWRWPIRRSRLFTCHHFHVNAIQKLKIY